MHTTVVTIEVKLSLLANSLVGGRIIVMKKLLLLVGNEDTKECEATNLGPSCPLFAYNENEGKK